MTFRRWKVDKTNTTKGVKINIIRINLKEAKERRIKPENLGRKTIYQKDSSRQSLNPNFGWDRGYKK